ncbi:hypothetical protein BJ742DRAFT_799973 [Cladochytrium replicatum]|nr:hypothetical protein BJ742DRAFT_799973 [Cladochytrium replicatum]
MFNRVVHARIYRNGNYTLQKGGQVVVSIQQVARSLSMLKPTYVRGLIRLDNNDDLSPGMIRDFITVRQAVITGSPSCKFDIELEALQFSFGDGKAIKDKLQMIWDAMRLNPGFQIDAIFFDHWNQAFADSPIAMLVATFFIHQDMKLALGGNTYGGDVPPNTDFVSLTTRNFLIPPPKPLTHPVPVIGAMLSSAPSDFASESCAFNAYLYYSQSSSTSFRIKDGPGRYDVIRSIAYQQNAGGYAFSWPIFYPECPTQRSYDSVDDWAAVSNPIPGKSTPGPGNMTLYDWMATVLIPMYAPDDGGGLVPYSFPLNPNWGGSNDTGSSTPRRVGNTAPPRSSSSRSIHGTLVAATTAAISALLPLVFG